MEGMRLVLAAVVLLTYPLLPGSLFGYLRQKRKEKGLQQNIYLLGVLVYGALFAVLAFVSVRKNLSFVWFSRLALFCSLGLAAVVAVCLWLVKGYRGFTLDRLGKIWKSLRLIFNRKPDKAGPVVVVAYLLVAFGYVLRPFPLETGFDTAERVITLLQTGLLSGTNPMTGEVTGAVVSLKESFTNLPLFYGCVCRWFSVSPTKLLFEVIPFVNLFLFFQVMDAFAGCFWAGEKEMKGEADRNRSVNNDGRKALFLLFVALLTLCGNKAYMNTSYGILHFPYEGMTMFSSALLPLCFVVCFKGGTSLKDMDFEVLVLLMVNAVFLAGFEKGIVILLMEILVILISRLVFQLWKRRSRLWK